MEIVFTNKKSELLKDKQIIGFYGDVLDLIKLGVDIEGIEYDDEWTVKRFLSGVSIRPNKRINDIFKYLELDLNILKTKLKELTKTDFKFVLLAKLLINNNKIIIFDKFDINLSYTDKKRLIRILRALKKDGISIVIISRDLVFLSQIIDTIIVADNGEIEFDGYIGDLLELSLVNEEEIIKFINLANKSGAKLDMTLDSKELLKDIYRSVY